MRKIIYFLINAILLIFFANSVYGVDWTVDVTVAQDGSADYTTIAEAINNNPDDGSNYVIFINDGVYDEKLFIEKNNITLIGESRENTIITQAILRRIFRETNDSDWGVATINVGENVTNLTLANLTVRNNFADLNPDVSNNTDHTMTIRGGGDKIIIVNCNIIATGGDTLSLWNTNGGRYYHSGCYFEGYVDYVCPRGYCYISNSDFFGYNTNASIWHDGSGGKDHKLVVKNSNFDGVSNFGLGRYHRMAAFYVLDCNFTENLSNNGGINYVGDSAAQDRDKLIYGVRTYFDKSTRETGDYNWHENNLATAENSPTIDEITDSWTFNNTWMPEEEITGLLECAFLPSPGYYAKKIGVNPTLNWLAGKNAVSHLLYFGDTEEVEFLAELADTSYVISNELDGASRYYWRVDEVLNDGDTVRGSVWTFTTNVSEKPTQVTDPYPPVDTNYFKYTLMLDWKANSAEVDTFYLYFGSKDNLELLNRQTGIGYYLEGLGADSTYYWRVDAKNDLGITQGPLWYFNYKPTTSTIKETTQFNSNSITIYPNPTVDNLTVNFIMPYDQKVILSIYDLTGRLVYNEYVENLSSDTFNHKIDLSRIAGMKRHQHYFLNVDYGENKETLPFMVL